jgi:hypothetical protein
MIGKISTLVVLASIVLALPALAKSLEKEKAAF